MINKNKIKFFFLGALFLIGLQAYCSPTDYSAELGHQVSNRTECVVLIHGLARSSNSFILMQLSLRRQNYRVVNVNYPSTESRVEDLASIYVSKGINRCQKYKPNQIHFVTHSMGGILVRYYLKYLKWPQNLGKVVMLAPPNKGSELVDKLKDSVPAYDWWNGPAGRQLGTEPSSLPNQLGPVDYPVGVIAGTKKSLIFSRYINGPNDGKVSVESTKITGMSDHISVYASHTFIMNNRQVQRQTVYFLKNGVFDY